uniref:NADH dehydrogenase subunit 6 n=1 Tax=Hygrobates longiporus TaxID=2740590 RepID=A0A6J4EE60_9ACAR|nr:NADH dehydrogenase subunit 6 [Hygrobates longiporus]BCG28127.1 NADH dehydrogenase subunit 6 [Hygrobates longiporus]
MLLLTFTLMLSSIAAVTFSNSIMMILSILFITILGVLFNFQSVNNQWISFMILFIMVGGLMIIYIFVLSLNSNDKLESKFSANILPLIFISILFTWSINSNFMSKEFSKLIYNNFSTMIFFLLIIILIMMYFSSKIILNPSSPSKSMK